MTAAELAARMAERQASVQPAFRRATTSLVVAALRFAKLKLTELIYSQPIPIRPRSGKPKWRRTGNLRRSERSEVRSAYSGAVVNDASYAVPRHEMGKPGHRQTIYPAHWHDELRHAFRGKAQAAYREAVREILQRGGI